MLIIKRILMYYSYVLQTLIAIGRQIEECNITTLIISIIVITILVIMNDLVKVSQPNINTFKII